MSVTKLIFSFPKLTIYSAIIVLLSLSSCHNSHQKAVIYHSFHPGKQWFDTDSIHINAHGGGILYYDHTYYWFGEFKTTGRKGNSAQVGVNCYASTDLYNWKDEGIALTVSKKPGSDIEKGCILERPKVIYNKKTGKFVMWFHLELKGQGYGAARTGVAVSDKVIGPYKFIKSLRPNKQQWPIDYPKDLETKSYPANLKWWTPDWYKAIKEGMFLQRDYHTGQMSRDMTLFVDDDGKAYHIHASEDNLTLQISQLTDDYLGFNGKFARIAPAGHNEAPALFKYNGYYYLMTSGCTGWAPNAARLFRAKSIWGQWEALGNPCRGKDAELTFHSQSTYILPVAGKKNAFIYMGDRWRPKNPIDGRYIWLPIRIESGKPVIRWADKWNLSVFD